MEDEFNEPKHFCIMPFKCSKDKQSNELNECWTLMMKFGIIGKTMTSNEKTWFWKYFVVIYGHVESNIMISEQEYGPDFHCSRDIAQ